MQITDGIHSMLSFYWVYNGFQKLIGADKVRTTLAHEYIRPKAGEKILDIGCGTGEILKYLPDTIQYHGYDLSKKYILHAKECFKEKGIFKCADVTKMMHGEFGQFDTVLASGLLHHLDDQEVHNIINSARKLLKPNGKLIKLDCCYTNQQSLIARYLIDQDRGKNVRTEEGYRSLVAPYFKNIHVDIKNDVLRLPYTHIFMICTNPIEKNLHENT